MINNDKNGEVVVVVAAYRIYQLIGTIGAVVSHGLVWGAKSTLWRV